MWNNAENQQLSYLVWLHISDQPEGRSGKLRLIRKAGDAACSWDCSPPSQDVVTVTKALQWDFWEDTLGGTNEGEGEGIWKGESPSIL